uniref:Uncharacterized protein n=1 Tax=Tanacetum cinerariifolium TaxID=118510 RepID=A0A6L2MGP7_TANCI|nr:hypothetical protein [Tanacetum cinerariifolium]
MAETMEQYMSKTRADYRSGVARPKIENKDNFKLKGQLLKELRTNTFSVSDHKDANEHIEKVLKIVDLFHIPNITINQVMLRTFPKSLTEDASRWLRNKPTGSITTWEGASVSVMPLLTYLNLGSGEFSHTKLTIELADRTVKYPKGIAKNVLVRIVLENMDDCRDEGMGYVIFGKPFLRDVGFKTRQSEGMITIHKGNDDVTYQMIEIGIDPTKSADYKVVRAERNSYPKINSRKYNIENSFTLGSIKEADKVKILQSCNGLLLCIGLRRNAFDYVYNSSINLLKILSEPDYANVYSNVYGCAGLRIAFDPTKSPYYKVMQSYVWSIRYHVDTDDFMTLLPERWSIRSTVWSIVLGEKDDGSFLVINLSGKVVEYNLISNNLREIYDMRSNQLTDDYHDGLISPIAMYDM